jgi:hypothetical protein
MSEEALASAADLALVQRLTTENTELRAALEVALAELDRTRPHVFTLAKQLGRCDMAFDIILQCTSATQAKRTARRMRAELAPKARSE